MRKPSTLLKSFKEKQYLVFEFVDGQSVKYDLSNSCMIGKKGNPVKCLTNQLSGIDISDVIESFSDEKYRQFLRFIRNDSSKYTWYKNMGTFLTKIKSLSRFEQFFAAGITNFTHELKYSLSEIPRDLIRLSSEFDFNLSNKAVEQYKLHKDVIRNILSMEFTSIVKQELVENVLTDDFRSAWNCFNDLILVHNYRYESLMKYVDNLMAYEALDGLNNVLRELHDYTGMMSKLSHKFEKYPKHFLTTHKIASRNYNRLKQDFPEELFEKIRNDGMNCTIDDFKFTYPKSAQCIKDEAVQQQNCLASYIQKVLDGESHIIFMRMKDKPDDSLITLEVKGSRVCQARGKFNREPDEGERIAIEKYNQRLSKKYGGMKNVS